MKRELLRVFLFVEAYDRCLLPLFFHTVVPISTNIAMTNELTTSIVIFFFVCGLGSCDFWAVVGSTSRHWHNYRHTSNALSIKWLLQRNRAVDNGHLLLLLAELHACDPRNKFPGRMFSATPKSDDVGECRLLLDASGGNFDAQGLLEILHGVSPSGSWDRLSSSSASTILLYLTGHSAEDVTKIQDSEFLSAIDLARSIDTLFAGNRFRRLLVLFDTCEGETICEPIHTPNVVCIAGSKRGQSSFAYQLDEKVGIELADRMTFELVSKLRTDSCLSARPTFLNLSLREFFSGFRLSDLHVDSTTTATSLLDEWKVRDFFCPPEPSQSSITHRFEF